MLEIGIQTEPTDIEDFGSYVLSFIKEPIFANQLADAHSELYTLLRPQEVALAWQVASQLSGNRAFFHGPLYDGTNLELRKNTFRALPPEQQHLLLKLISDVSLAGALDAGSELLPLTGYEFSPEILGECEALANQELSNLSLMVIGHTVSYLRHYFLTKLPRTKIDTIRNSDKELLARYWGQLEPLIARLENTTITVQHATSLEAAEAIIQSGGFTKSNPVTNSYDGGGVYVGIFNAYEGWAGDQTTSTLFEFTVPATQGVLTNGYRPRMNVLCDFLALSEDLTQATPTGLTEWYREKGSQEVYLGREILNAFEETLGVETQLYEDPQFPGKYLLSAKVSDVSPMRWGTLAAILNVRRFVPREQLNQLKPNSSSATRG